MKVCIKLPTRERPKKFLSVLDKYRSSVELPGTFFLINVDIDDTSTYNTEVFQSIEDSRTMYHVGHPEGKISACNRGLEGLEWDVLLLASDDMIPQVQGLDKIIVDAMTGLYPDTDGALWFNDGYTKNTINTIVCIGRKRYDRFGYLYHPSYKSLFCDNEYTDVGRRDGKLTYISDVIVKHEHPMRVKTEVYDDLYKKNESYWKEDQANYYKRKKEGFI